MEEVNTLTPFVTKDDVKRVFSCEDDKAKEIMQIPDLHQFQLGRAWYVPRIYWDAFIDNLINYNGLRDLSHGFTAGFIFKVPEPPYAWNALAELGFNRDDLERIINNAKKERQNQN